GLVSAATGRCATRRDLTPDAWEGDRMPNAILSHRTAHCDSRPPQHIGGREMTRKKSKQPSRQRRKQMDVAVFPSATRMTPQRTWPDSEQFRPAPRTRRASLAKVNDLIVVSRLADGR